MEQGVADELVKENHIQKWPRGNGSPVVAGHELASAVIQDTVQYLGIQATGISHLNGPYLQVRNVGPDASDILFVGSWRAHYEPGGNGSRPILDALPLAGMKQPGSPAADALGRARLTQAGSPTARVLGAAPSGGLHPEQAQGHGDTTALPHHGRGGRYEQQQQPWELTDGRGAGERCGGPSGAAAPHMHPGAAPPERPGPIIEECSSDAEPSSQAGDRGRQQQQRREKRAGELAEGDFAASAHAPPRSVPIGQLAESLSDPDRVMEDASVQEQQGQPPVQATALPSPGQAPLNGKGAGSLMNGPAVGGAVVHLAGPALTTASAFASAAAAEAAAAGGMAHISAEAVPAAGPLVLSPRPRSEWELDPAKIVLGRRLAVGGFGEVFVAKYEGTLVAVKRLLASDSDTTQRFIDEVHMLARLRHPNLLLFMGFTLTPEPSIVTEFMARGSLFHILRQAGNRPPDPRMQRAVAVSVARGMAYLHSRQPPILHLDLKSPNVLVDDRWRVKIADFGLSRVRQRTYVSSGAAAGSPEWMAPEVLRCDHYAEAADVYSFGVVLWELLTGQAPWADLNAMQVVGAVGFARRSLPDPTEGDPLLVHLCKACRAYEPAQRPSFAQIVEAMDSHFGPPPWPAVPGGPAAGNHHVLPADEPAAGGTASKALPPALPPPESTMRDASGAEGVVAAPAAAAAGPAAPPRLTRRHSLASGSDAETAAAAAGAAAPPSFGGVAVPPRLDARFASVHESPRSRRRYRSPRSEDMMLGPPAITARLQDGRKTPSPRTASGRAFRIGTFDSCEEYEVAPAQAKQEQEQLAAGVAAAVTPAPPPEQHASGSKAVPADGTMVGRLPPARASPFADLAAADFGPGSAADVRALRLDSALEAAAGEAGGACDHAQSMELGSPVGSVRATPSLSSPQLGEAQGRTGSALAQGTGGAGPPPQPESQFAFEVPLAKQELPQHEQHLAKAQAEAQPNAVSTEPPPLGQPRQEQEQPAGSPSAQRPSPLGRLLGRPGHRRVASDEVGHLQRLQTALAASAAPTEPDSAAAGPLTAAAGPIAATVALQQQQQQQQHQRLTSAVAAAAALPPAARRSRGLARNSAPMRYTYGGAPSGGSSQPQRQLQSPPRPRSHHAHHLAHALQQQLQQQALGMRMHQYYLQHGSTDVSAQAAAAAGVAALAAPVSLSPLHPDPAGALGGEELGPRREAAAAGDSGALMPAGGAGADPWADNQSELSFAFILHEDNASVCSDEYLRSTSLDRMPLVEEDEDMEPSAAGIVLGAAKALPSWRRQGGRGSSGGVVEGAADLSFDLPRPFLSPSHPVEPPASPFMALAASAQLQPGSVGPNGDGAAPPSADLWAALQQHSSQQQLAAAAWLQGPRQAEVAAGGDAGRLCTITQPELRLEGPVQHDQNKAIAHSQGVIERTTILQPRRQLSETLSEPVADATLPPRAASGSGGVTTYRTGRFKVTIEPAASDAQPPVQTPAVNQQQEQHQQQMQQQAHIHQVEQKQQQDRNFILHQPATATVAAVAADGAAAAVPIAVNCTAKAGSGPASPCGSAGAPLIGTSPAAPGTCGRTRISHHGACHGELSGGPPVALNSVTMYRKGRFFVSHAAAGTHSLSVTNPFAAAATSSLAAAAGGVGGGASSTDSPHDDSDDHDGASGPASPLGVAGNAAAAPGLPSRQGSAEGSPTAAAKPLTWAAVAAMPPPAKPAAEAPIVVSGRQYSRGRFTVAESIISAPPPEPRRPSYGSATGELPRVGSADREVPAPLAVPATAAAAPAATAAPPSGAAGPLMMPHVQSAPCMGPPALQLQPAQGQGQAAQAVGGGGQACHGGHTPPATAPASPRGEHVVVRRVGRFTVREVEAGSNASSRGPSSSGGTPVEGIRPEALPAGLPSAAAAAAAAAGMLLSVGGRAGSSTQGSPPEDAHLLCSRHSSCSFACPSEDCSRSSSQGLEMELGTQPASQPQPQKPRIQQTGQAAPQASAEEARASPGGGGAIAAAAGGATGRAATPKILRIQSKGRFTVIEHAAPAAAPDAQQFGPAAPPALPQAVPAPALAHGEGVAATAGPSDAQADQEMAAAPAAASLPPPHGGVLHPPPPPPRPPLAPPHGGPFAGAATQRAAAAPAPWGQSGPQAPEQAAQLHADMARMVRERMSRNERERRQQRPQEQEGQEQRAAEHGEGGGGAGGAGDRCTYEVSFGRSLTIQISHELQDDGAGEDEGAADGVDGDDEDEVMVDVGIIHEEVEADDSDGSDREEDREQERGGGGVGGDLRADWEQPPLQPPGTPAHQAAHERSWLVGGDVGLDWQRRGAAGGGSGSSDSQETGDEDDSMEC